MQEKRAAIYARVAAFNSVKLAQQVQQCSQYCYENDYDIYRVWMQTGSFIEAQEELFKLAKEGVFTVLVVSDLYRLSRDQVRLLDLLVALSALGVQVVSVMDGVIDIDALKHSLAALFTDYINSQK